MREKYVRNAREFGPDPVELKSEDVVIPDAGGSAVSARYYWPDAAIDSRGCLVWLHGGGWFVGALDGVDRTARALARASGSRVLAVDYRLAPEFPYPHALADVDRAVAWARTDGAAEFSHDPTNVAVGGDSSGGNLATIAVRHAVQSADLPALAAQVLVYPVTDVRMDTASYSEPVAVGSLSPEAMSACWGFYLGAGSRDPHPDISPIDGDVAGMPRTLIVLAGHDILREDGLSYAAALELAGVEVRVQAFNDLPHGFLDWSGSIDRAADAIAEIGRFVQRRERNAK
jgi:acetyl esterase